MANEKKSTNITMTTKKDTRNYRSICGIIVMGQRKVQVRPWMVPYFEEHGWVVQGEDTQKGKK